MACFLWLLLQYSIAVKLCLLLTVLNPSKTCCFCHSSMGCSAPKVFHLFYINTQSSLYLLTDVLACVNSNGNPTIISTCPQPSERIPLSCCIVFSYGGSRIICKALLYRTVERWCLWAYNRCVCCAYWYLERPSCEKLIWYWLKCLHLFLLLNF